MRNSFSNVRYLLFALLMFTLTACGTSNPNTAGTASLTGTSKVTANLILPNKSAAKTVGLLTGAVTTRLTVTGATIPTARQDFPTTAGGSIAVYPGSNLIVTAQAFDINGNFLYEGFATNVTVVAGTTPTTVTIQLNAPIVKVNETACLGCHDSSKDASGQALVADYKQSAHYTNITGDGINGVPGCAGCHNGPSHSTPDPSASGRCFTCHTATLNPAHSNTQTGTGVRPAMYVATNYQNNCSACHEPHNPINGLGKDERTTWALSDHGDVNGAAWATEDFQTGQVACQRCHTATGYKNFAISNFANFPTTSWASPTDTNREVLACDACHSNDKFDVRTVGSFTAPYNSGNSPKTFPSVGTSSLCIACHSARESGDTILGITTNLNNTGFKNSHYMGAAAVMYMSNAFVAYTSQTTKVPTNTENITTYTYSATKTYNTYNQPDIASVPAYGVVGGTTSAHRKIGTPLIAGSETYLPAGGIAITTNGPCVSCHMQADNAIPGDTTQNSAIPVPAFRPGHGHSLQIDQSTAQQICLPCHADAPHLDGGDGLGNGKYTPVVDLATLTSAQIEPQSVAFQNALALLEQILSVKYMIKYDPAVYPYFYDMQKDPTGATAVTDWTRANVAGVTDAAVLALGPTFTAIPAGGFSQTQAMRLMGACFNLNLLVKDPGAYVHARTFTQRLIYDALDFLDNNAMDFTALNSARALNPAIYHGTSVNVHSLAATLATESMIYMSGTHYSDTTAGDVVVPMKLHP